MIKLEYISLHGQLATAMAGSAEFRALLETAREECPQFGKDLSDPSMLVRSEGFLQGWNAALKFLKTAHVPAVKPKEQTGPVAQYKDPADFPLNPPPK